MNIIHDTDNKLGYETDSLSRKFLNSFCVPILNLLPAKSNFLIRKSHKSVDEVVENATTHAALEVLYKKGDKKHTNSLMKKILHSIWFNTGNSKAVRNRLKIVKREITSLLSNFSTTQKEINLVSIASGSARAVIESIKEAKMSSEITVSVTFIDKNPNALRYSEDLLTESKLSEIMPLNKYQWINNTAGSFLRESMENSIDIVEMVGLLDYFDEEKAVNIFKYIHKALKNDGVFITANICPNKEQKFLTNAIDWKMIYRTADELGLLLVKAGFLEPNIVLYYEPLGIHCIAVSKKR